MKAIIRVMFVLIIVVSVSSAQTGTNPGTGFPAFGSFAGSEFDTVNEGKLNVHFEIPIVQKSGRGLSLVGRLAYDSLIWSAVPGPRDANGNPLSPAYFWPTAVPVTPYGWYYMPVIGYVSYTWSETPPVCPNHDTITLRDNYTYHDPSGTAHSIGSQQAVVRDCDGVGHGFGPALARDASGFTITVDSAMRVSVVSVDGTLIHPSQNGGGIGDFPGLVTDTNGNQISYDPPTGGDTDTLGVVALKFVPNSGGASITYPSPTNPANFVGVTLNYSNYQVRSNFGCAYITDYYIAQTAPLVNSVVMPD